MTNHEHHDHSHSHHHEHHEHHHHEHHHHEHHHHEHDENCTCEHCHFEHNGATFHLSMDLHDGAVVASAKGTLQTEHTLLQQTFKQALKQLADTITAEGGIIGHIKSAVEFQGVETYSITLDTVNVESPAILQIQLIVNAIVFCVETERLEELIKECLATIAETNH